MSFLPEADDLILRALDNYMTVETYVVTLRSTKDSLLSEEIRYYYKKPGHIRMEFIIPHKGAVLVYNPETNKVRLRPFGFLKPFVLTLSPDNSLIKSSKGHTVDESDIGALLSTIRELQSNGVTEVLGEESISGRPAFQVRVVGEGAFTVDVNVHQYYLWLDKETLMPLRASAYDVHNDLIEEVLMDDLEINRELSESLFDL
jgi:outer membrane lipoprotein-sorting protein